MENINHELTVLVSEKKEQTPVLQDIERLIIKNHGTILKFEDEGRKRLAYPIMGEEYAYYYYYEIELPKNDVQDLSRALNINDDVLRYLLIQERSVENAR